MPWLGGLAALAAAVPAPAAALSTSVAVTSIDGPNAAMTQGNAPAPCSGRLVSGGGARVAQAVLSNGTHLVGSFPTPDGIGQSASADANPVVWIGAGGIGGQATSGVTTWGYGICVDAGPTATTVVATTRPGPSETFTGVLATATCPAGTRLLSGGARTTPGTVGSLKPNGSFPSDASGRPVLSGVNPTSWTAAGLNGGQPPASNQTHAFAICQTAGPELTVTVRNAIVDGPTEASTGDQVTTTCPPGTVLLGGGGYISDDFGLPGSQGDHLTGTFPSDAAGNPVTAGSASSWTASSHIGGTPSGPLTDTNVWAMCASERAPGDPAPPPPAVATNAGPLGVGITTNQIREAMRREMFPKGRAATIPALLRARGAQLTVKALDAGVLTIKWHTTPVTTRAQRRAGKKARPVLIAQGRKTFARSGARPVNVRLNAAGRRALTGAKRVPVTATGTFLRNGSRTPIVGKKGFVVTRNAASTSP